MENFSLETEKKSLVSSDDENVPLGCNGPTFRLVLILSHIANGIQSIIFWFNIPSCCSPDVYSHFAVLPGTGIVISVINILHLFCIWPNMNNTHYYLTGCYESICFVNMVLLTFAFSITNVYSLILTLIGAVFSLGSHSGQLSDVEESDACCSTWFKWNLRLFMLIQFVQIILIIVAFTTVKEEDLYYFETAYTANQPTETWTRNFEDEEENLFVCQSAYNLSQSYISANGGRVDKYCTALSANYTGGCCLWHNPGN